MSLVNRQSDVLGHQPGPSGSLGRAMLRTARPKQWTKNVLVVAAPGAAGALGKISTIDRVAGLFLLFCLLASGTYYLNDVLDAPADRCHPDKARRPVAAGEIPLLLAGLTGVTLVAAGVGGSAVFGWRTVVVFSAYVAVQFAYSLWLKHEPVFDLACVSSGFVLRGIVGGVALHLPISQWFLIVATFGSMLMVTGKRFAEFQQLGDDRGSHRRSLDAYSEPFLRLLIGVSTAVSMTAYCLWAFEKESQTHHSGICFQLSVVPFVLALLRYAYMIETGHGSKPEDVVLSDRPLQIVGLVWLAIFALGVYA
jgi:decaprenyl-phosphate phosphoribosyltransferase